MVCAVVDWNPCGMHIMKTYWDGGDGILAKTSLGQIDLAWLALHAEQVDGLPADCFQQLTDHDRPVLLTTSILILRILTIS